MRTRDPLVVEKPALPIPRFAAFQQMYREIARSGSGTAFFQGMLDRLNIELSLSDAELRRIPATGPCVIVANHPYGLLDGAAVMAQLPRVRTDVKVLANSMLASVAEVSESFFAVDVFGGPAAVMANQRALRQALTWVRDGHALVVFPAGEVSHLQMRHWSITDPPWSPIAARILRRTNAAVVPLFIHGANSLLFQLAGLVHSRLRTALLPHEFLNKQRHTVEMRVGHAIPFARLAATKSDEAVTRYLRWRTYLLGEGRARSEKVTEAKRRSRLLSRDVSDEVDGLASSSLVVKQGSTRVFLAAAREIPRVLDEIGELREFTFRAVGEGTGRNKDLDSFDQHYLHLFSWNAESREVIGAYRLGPTDEILRTKGTAGLYTSTLFRYRRELLYEIYPALELGRSFVRPEYQRLPTALAMLWRGIGAFLVRHPRYRTLFGPVSISNNYQPLSRKMLVRYLEENVSDIHLSRLVRPRKAFATTGLPRDAAWTLDLEEVSSIIADLERDGKGVPVLIRQYLRLGGKLVGFNLDPAFSNCLDGLIVVDLARTEPLLLARYLGSEGAAMFLRHHTKLVA